VSEGPAIEVQQHGGQLALSVAQAHGVETMFTLSGAHVFPLYDAAVNSDPPMRIVDVRHEQTAVFAAEATAKLTRRPGLAVVTAGPGVTNGISAVAQAHFSGIPLLVLGGRAPAYRWSTGSLQELDHPPLLASVTRYAATAHTTADIAHVVAEALHAATTPHRGPAFVDVPMDQLFAKAAAATAEVSRPSRRAAADDDVTEIARLLAGAARPVLVLGSDVWTDAAETAALRLVETTGIPAVTNGMGRGVIPRGHPLLVSKARTIAFAEADLVIVGGTPLDFRLNYGSFGQARVVHIADAEDQLTRHVTLAAAASGDLELTLEALATAWEEELRRPTYEPWVARLRDAATAREAEATAQMSAVAPHGIHPARVYGELLPLLGDDTVVICDGGDFVSWAGRFIEPARPGCWLDPGPYGCLGAGLGAAMAARMARPDSPVVVLLGDGAAGFSLFDVDTLVRHRLPVLLIVGNNGVWGLEKGPMRMLYGYDVATNLRRETRYDAVVEALGGRGETAGDPHALQAALRRGLAAGEPYLVNVLLDPTVSYPRSTTGV
jgi:acetolactate synthase I/II/III large subunit